MSEPVGFSKATYADLKLMIVDDDAGTRRMIRKILQQIGISTIVECGDGLEAVQEVLRTRPDIVLCDIHMSPVDGNQFLKMLREARIGWVHRLPIVFLTSDNLKESVVSAMENKVDGYLVKPVSLGVLKNRIDAIVTKVRADEELRNTKL